MGEKYDTFNPKIKWKKITKQINRLRKVREWIDLFFLYKTNKDKDTDKDKDKDTDNTPLELMIILVLNI